MSSVEAQQNQDFVPDAEAHDVGKEPDISCKHCIHKDVCYFLTMLDQNRQSFEMSGILTMPFSPYILATTCKKFDNGKSKADNMTKEDTVVPEEEIQNVDTSEE